MSKRDPYFEVKAEVESSLVSAAALHSSYNRILLTVPPDSHATSDELSWARSELNTTLSALVADVSELDDVVSVLEQDIPRSGHGRFGVSEDEVRKRRAWVKNVQQELEKMQKTADPSSQRQGSSYHPLMPSASSAPPQASKPPQSHHRPFRDESAIDMEDETEEFHHAQQSMMIDQQDRTLGTISGVVGVLREQASLMGREISEHNILLEDLEENIDRTESRIAKANRKLNQFVVDNKNSKSSWLILVLIIVLVCLLLAIIFV